jgi:hypothetical protein
VYFLSIRRGCSSVEPTMMAKFNRIFSTQRLLQIIVVLGATVLMRLLG